MMKNKIKHTLIIALACGLTSLSSAQVLMLNFGGGTAATGGNLTNSPYNTADPGFSDTTWNTLGKDGSSTLNWADGTAATGVELDLGVANLAVSNTVDLSAGLSGASDLGTATNIGVYTGNSIGKGGIFDGSTTNRTQVGAQITGLAAGTYDVYITGRNTNATLAGLYPYTYYAGAGTAGANFDFTGYDNQSLAFDNNSGTAAWVEAGNAEANYAKITISLSAGQALNILSNGDGGSTTGAGGAANANRGFLNSIQVVAIPEPATWATLFGAFALVGVILRRRIKQ